MSAAVTIDSPDGLAVLALQINAEHAQAQKHAGIAIEHARRAGELLIRVKDELPHGQWLPWLAANCAVSDRQAQRYMRAARGLPLPMRAIKTDTVSHFDVLNDWKRTRPQDSWVHYVEELGISDGSSICLFDLNDVNTQIWIEPANSAGWFYTFRLTDLWTHIEHYRRPTNIAGVAVILDLLRVPLQPSVVRHRREQGRPWIWQSLLKAHDDDEVCTANAVALGLMREASTQEVYE